jgi:predicted ester cyclase
MIHVTNHHWLETIAGPSVLFRNAVHLHQERAMTDSITNENKRGVDRLFKGCFNRGDLSLLDELVSPDYVGAQGDRGPAGFKGIVVGLRTAFPDIHYTLDDVVAEADKVAVRWRWSGTHEGVFRAFPATHKTVSNTGAGIFQFRGGQIVAASLETDRLGFLQQIGAVPPDVPVPSNR